MYPSLPIAMMIQVSHVVIDEAFRRAALTLGLKLKYGLCGNLRIRQSSGMAQAQLSYMSLLVAAGDQSTLTNVQAACDVGGAMASSFQPAWGAGGLGFRFQKHFPGRQRTEDRGQRQKKTTKTKPLEPRASKAPLCLYLH